MMSESPLSSDCLIVSRTNSSICTPTVPVSSARVIVDFARAWVDVDDKRVSIKPRYRNFFMVIASFVCEIYTLFCAVVAE